MPLKRFHVFMNSGAMFDSSRSFAADFYSSILHQASIVKICSWKMGMKYSCFFVNKIGQKLRTMLTVLGSMKAISYILPMSPNLLKNKWLCHL